MGDKEPNIKGDKASNLQRFVCDGNDALEFKLVRSLKDLYDGEVFHPEMCHQVFNEGETIFGYENLSIRVYLTAGSLKTYMGVNYSRKISTTQSEGLEPDNVVGKMNDVLRGGYIENLDEFSALIENEEKAFRPLGELIHGFTTTFRPRAREDASTANGHGTGESKKSFEVYLVDGITSPKFIQYLKRIETFLLFFVDAGSFLDCEEDEKWKFFTLYEKYKTSDGSTAYAFVGYSSVYQFFVYPDLIRPRIAQMLILPPFQKQGLAIHLLSCEYEHYRKNLKVKEITVEDPSDDFELLRDFVDARDCKMLSSYSKEKLKKGFSSEMTEEARRVLKMTKRQARRVYEILRLEVTNVHDELEFKEYRLDVKRRLNMPYQRQESDIKRILSRKCNDPEISKQAALDDSTRKTELESNFQLLLSHYQNIVRRLEKFT